MSKTVHIVFQVLNFLVSEAAFHHKLLPIDNWILTVLAKHHGAKGIFPSQQTIAKECRIKVRHLRYRLNYMQSINLISINRIGRKHYYNLDFLSTTEALQCPYDNSNSGTTVHSIAALCGNNSGTTVPHINIEEEPKKKTERKRTNRALPLSDDFMVNKESNAVAKAQGLTEDEANHELDKFFTHYMGNGEEKADWNAVLQNWMIRAGEYKRKKRPSSHETKQEEPRSSVPWFRPDPLQQISNYLPQGVKPNGLGRDEEGER